LEPLLCRCGISFALAPEFDKLYILDKLMNKVKKS